MNSPDDVIAALATPVGEGGIAVIRVSGKNAFIVVDKSFNGNVSLGQSKSHTAHYGLFFGEKRKKIDEVIVTVFREPHSYTGENTVEISCHGGSYIVKKIIERLLDSGARQAEPGEFTKRAFLNGRIDLAQAEAVADLIHASSEYAHQISISQLDGRLSHKIQLLKDRLLDICSLLEVELDFSEQEIGYIDSEKTMKDIQTIKSQIDEMIDSYESGRISKEGIRVVILGEPNVGKSSIFNCLIDNYRAIVTPVEGTTRDSIEEHISLEGVTFNVIDTAGIRHSEDIVEKEGIKRTYGEIKKSDIAILVKDCTNINNRQVTFENIENILPKNSKIITVFNKFDLIGFEEGKIKDQSVGNSNVILSAKTGFGIKDLKKKLFESSKIKDLPEGTESVILTSLRHFKCLKDANLSIESAIKSLEKKVSNEFIVSDLRIAIGKLESVIGVVTSDEILNNIFSNFCIGK